MSRETSAYVALGLTMIFAFAERRSSRRHGVTLRVWLLRIATLAASYGLTSEWMGATSRHVGYRRGVELLAALLAATAFWFAVWQRARRESSKLRRLSWTLVAVLCTVTFLNVVLDSLMN